jgi:hypothetical protein
MGLTASEQTASRNRVVYARHLVIERKGGPLVRPHIITYLSGARRVLVRLQLQKRAGTGVGRASTTQSGQFSNRWFLVHFALLLTIIKQRQLLITAATQGETLFP